MRQSLPFTVSFFMSASSPAASIAAWVFDAYGTLFDVHSLAVIAERLAPGKGAALSRLWRTKQLEYTWLASLMALRPREDFAALTGKALDYATAALDLPWGSDERAQLISAYRSLTPFPDAKATLIGLAPRPRWILSNGTLAMLEPLLQASGIDSLLDGVLSVDAAGIFKPAPQVYQLAVDRLRLAPAQIGFVSANGWDATGAKAFGLTTFWINRGDQPVERHGPPPNFIVGSLAELPELVGG